MAYGMLRMHFNHGAAMCMQFKHALPCACSDVLLYACIAPAQHFSVYALLCIRIALYVHCSMHALLCACTALCMLALWHASYCACTALCMHLTAHALPCACRRQREALELKKWREATRKRFEERMVRKATRAG